jgi:hypothetical protein
MPKTSMTALAPDDRAGAEDAEPDERRPVARLDQREGSQQRRRAGEQGDRQWVSPAGVGRLDDRVDEQGKRAGDRERPSRVVAPLRRRRPALAKEERREREGGHADGDVDEEDPLPAEAVDNRAADQPSRGRPDPAQSPPDPERLVALGPLLEGGRDDRECARGHDRRPDALEGTRADQRVVRPGEPAEERCGSEDDEPDHEHAPAAEQVGCPPAEQEETGEGEGVGAHHPLQPLRRESELVLDRGERDGDDRRIEDDHEEGAAEERERPPTARIGNGSSRGRLHISSQS